MLGLEGRNHLQDKHNNGVTANLVKPLGLGTGLGRVGEECGGESAVLGALSGGRGLIGLREGLVAARVGDGFGSGFGACGVVWHGAPEWNPMESNR